MTQSRTLGRLLTAMGAAIAALALLAPVASAAEPAPGYEQFAGCPSPEENPAVTICFRAEINGGHFKMGKKNAPITNPIVLSGGYNTSGTIFDTSPSGGLSPSPQEVPGGLVGLTGLDWLVNFLGLEALKVYAVTELAGTPGRPLSEPFKLPVKIRLVNPALGNNCYVGSDSNPIILNLTTKTTNPPPPAEPISGTPFKLGAGDKPGITKASDGVYVDNAFAVPGADGCGLTLLGLPLIDADPLVNLQSGLPSPAGTNETRQEVDAEIATRAFVYP